MSRAAAVLWLVLLAPGSSLAAALEPVPFPDTSRMQSAVRQQLDAARARAERAGTAAAFGDCGRAFLVYELTEPAAACLRNAQRLDPKEPRWPYYLGHLHAGRGELDAAAAAFRQARDLRPQELAPLLRLGEVELQRGDLAAANEAFSIARSLAPQEGAAWYGLGLVALQKGDPTTAAGLLEEARRRQPKSGGVRYALGLALRKLGRIDEAKRYMAGSGPQPASFPDPWMAEIAALDALVPGHVARGSQALAAGRFAEAEEELRQAVEADPQHPTAWQLLAQARQRRGDLDGARQAYERAIAAQPTAAVPQGNLGRLLVQQGKVEEGIRHMQTAIELDPELTEVKFNLAVALLGQGDGARALPLLDAVLLETPRDVEALHYRGMALAALGRAAEAAAVFRRVVEAAPAVAAPRLAEARALLAAGNEAEARQRLEEAHAALPGEEPITLELVQLLSAAASPSARDGERARQLAEALLVKGPTSAREQAAAMALAELGRFDEAAAHQGRAIELARAEGAGVPPLQERLRSYQGRVPLRTPWRKL